MPKTHGIKKRIS